MKNNSKGDRAKIEIEPLTIMAIANMVAQEGASTIRPFSPTLFTGVRWISRRLENGYKGVFESLSKEKQSELIVRKANFAKDAEIYL